ncbi:MAG: hypothetical protein ABI639_03930 [Thermoanaerobaculia bacterium]
MPAVDFFYARPSCESCEKTRSLLGERKVTIRSERSTRNAFSEPEIRDLLATVDEVWIARGQKIDKRSAQGTRPVDLKGPTGKFRAPMLRRGQRLLVGFHVPSLEELVDDCNSPGG